jgi:hypothetical protein
MTDQRCLTSAITRRSALTAGQSSILYILILNYVFLEYKLVELVFLVLGLMKGANYVNNRHLRSLGRLGAWSWVSRRRQYDSTTDATIFIRSTTAGLMLQQPSSWPGGACYDKITLHIILPSFYPEKTKKFATKNECISLIRSIINSLNAADVYIRQIL